MAQLKTLSLHFLSLPSRRNYIALPPLGERAVLPALTSLKYRGTSKYLDTLVARIDATGLGEIDITFFSQPTMDASQLGRFINRIEILRPNSRANIQISKRDISIGFIQPGASTRLDLRVSCQQLDWQLSSMAQICNQFPPFLLSRIEDLGIETTKPSSEQDDMNGDEWPELIRSFSGAKDFRVHGELATTMLRALSQADGEHISILRSLHELCVAELRSVYGDLWEATKSFIASRWPSSGSVPPQSTTFPVYCRNEGMSGTPRRYFCTFCNSSFAEQQYLTWHNNANHMPKSSQVDGETDDANRE